MKLKISEIFYSLQGEGARSGTPTIFIRLSGCKAKNACYAMGIKCDTEFESGEFMDIDEILQWCGITGCKEITWTGGEPLDQLSEEIINSLKRKDIIRLLRRADYILVRMESILSAYPQKSQNTL